MARLTENDGGLTRPGETRRESLQRGRDSRLHRKLGGRVMHAGAPRWARNIAPFFHHARSLESLAGVGSVSGESDEDENGSSLGESDEDENGPALGESGEDENGSEEHGADESFCDIDDARFYGDSPVPARSPVPPACVLDHQVLSPSLETLEGTVYVSGNGELHPKATEVLPVGLSNTLLDWVAVSLGLVLFRFESGSVRVEGQEVFEFVVWNECPVALESMEKLAGEMMCFLILNFNSIWDRERPGYTH
ncbi:hypothetical protein FN846DRAFT_901798 [Sphaerosporella brunnea]|uniref:Uncharacterized protein n=1 Tax=Sphaerosporella brunnea TaxID=1250544 RepID=A0A5J5FBS2_9PEZI|nr:hypothetical protein FN846DRAFT_901798 [Sphaerosporella brunnea]